MPKNKKPAGGRPARNFEPRRGSKTSFVDRNKGRGRPAQGESRASDEERTAPRGQGSKSPKHRGYRPEEADTAKRRWTSQEKAGREESRGIRNHSRATESVRSQDDGRPTRDWQGRGARRSEGSESGRSWESRGAGRATDRGRGAPSGREAAGRREDRPFREDRPSRQDRPFRESTERRGTDRGGYEGRGAERRGSERGGARNYQDRPQRREFGGSERTGRSWEDRPRRDSADARGDRSYRDRPERGSFDRARPERGSFDRDRRPERGSFDRDRPERGSFDRDRRPARSWEDRPPRERARDTRPPRTDRDARPQRTAARPERDDRQDVVHERLMAKSVEATDVEGIDFRDLGLGDNIARALAELGASAPFPIQAATIPEIIAGRDVLARGRTGSGKTIAFGAPLVERILRARDGKRREFGRKPSAIILAPTRELALQIDRTVQPIARSVGMFTTQIYGGVPQGRQVGALKKGVDIIIGTPGRIEDLIEQGKLDLSEVSVAVLDEADHMCELGFLEPVQRILRHTADGSQKLLFSATLDREVSALVDEFLVDPAVYEVAGETQETGTIDHRVLVIDHRNKSEILRQLVDREGKTLVFSRTRAYAEQLAEEFDDVGIPAVSLHGDLNQAKRTRNLQRLTSGRVRVLVATDVAARGLHVDDIDLVIQADAPDEYKTYMHRSGRTGRAGAAGRVVTLITRQRRRRMDELLDRAEIDAPFDEVRPGDDVIDEIAGAPTVADLSS